MKRAATVCSGIGAPEMAAPADWEFVFSSDIESFPNAVRAHHWPHVPNLGDMTKFNDWKDYAIDVLIGGTPCQSFSVAGLRKGLDDARGNLMLTYGCIAAKYRPRWLLWENVPGVLSSNGGRDFAAFLGLITGTVVEVPREGWGNSGIIGGIASAYGAAYRVLDAQYFGVAQRRRRVFVVGHLGGFWQRAAAVLFERESLRGDSAPSRQTRQGASAGFECGPQGGRFTDLAPTMDARAKDGVMRNQLGVGGINLASAEAIPLQEIGKRQSGTPMNGVGHGKAGDPMFTLQKSAQHGVVQPIAFAQNTRDEVRQINGDGAIAGALAGEPGMKQQTYVALPESPAASVIAFEPVIASRDGGHVYEEISGTLRKEPGDNRMTIVQPGNDARAGRMRGREGCAGGGKGPLLSEEKSLTLAANTNDQVLFQPSVTGPITAGIHKGMRGSEGVESNWMVPEVCGTLSDGAHNGGGLNGQDAYTGRIIPALGIPGNWIGRKPENGGNGSVPNLEHSPTLTKTDLHAVMTGMAVRRLTPRECERLQGFPDDFTAITYRGKPAADGPRYKALGNSMAVPNIRWILSRIDLIDQLAPFSTT